jgi:hypothetical protein
MVFFLRLSSVDSVFLRLSTVDANQMLNFCLYLQILIIKPWKFGRGFKVTNCVTVTTWVLNWMCILNARWFPKRIPFETKNTILIIVNNSLVLDQHPLIICMACEQKVIEFCYGPILHSFHGTEVIWNNGEKKCLYLISCSNQCSIDWILCASRVVVLCVGIQA